MHLTLRQAPEGAPNFCFGLYHPDDTCEVFIQSDWEYASLASALGWVPCKTCGATDGTVACAHRAVGEMLAEAYDFLAARDGQTFTLSEV